MKERFYHYRVVVEHVVDGDTVDLWVDLGFRTGMRQRFRLLGIDTPEVRGPERVKGLAALAYLADIVKPASDAGKLVAKTEKPDSFGRWLVTLWVERDWGWADVGDLMVEGGHAVRVKG